MGRDHEAGGGSGSAGAEGRVRVRSLTSRPSAATGTPLIRAIPKARDAAARHGGLALLALAFAVAAVLWWLEPIAGGGGYWLGLEVTAALFGFWLVWAVRPSLMSGRWLLLLIFAVGSVGGAVRVIGLNAHGEVVRAYESLFAALSQGRNPYTCECIVHTTPSGERLGNFNYPPVEIWPYQAAQWLAGHWDVALLATAVLLCNAVAFALLFSATPRGLRLSILAFFPFLVLWELRTTIGMTMVIAAAIVAVLLVSARHERRWHRPALWVLFGVGLLTKFAMIPLFAVCWWSTTARRLHAAPAPLAARARELRGAAADLLVPVGIALVLCLPFGVTSVVRSTLLFNLGLDERAELATFYPNVVSGLLSWGRLEWLYPTLAVTMVLIAVLVAPRFRMLTAMLLATTVFLLASPTPEPQYLPLVLLLFLGALVERELRGGEARSRLPRIGFPSAADLRP